MVVRGGVRQVVEQANDDAVLAAYQQTLAKARAEAQAAVKETTDRMSAEAAERQRQKTIETGLRTAISISDALGLLIRATKGRTTVQYAPKGEKQSRWYAFRGFGPGITLAVDREWTRRNEEGERTKLPPSGPKRDDAGSKRIVYTSRLKTIGSSA